MPGIKSLCDGRALPAPWLELHLDSDDLHGIQRYRPGISSIAVKSLLFLQARPFQLVSARCALIFGFADARERQLCDRLNTDEEVLDVDACRVSVVAIPDPNDKPAVLCFHDSDEVKPLWNETGVDRQEGNCARTTMEQM